MVKFPVVSLPQKIPNLTDTFRRLIEIYWLEITVLLGMSLLSSFLIFHVGKIGFHFHDLSIVFDGGYRILQGQRPFVDFFSPIGPILFLQQAAFFELFGVNFDAYLLHAATLNIVSAVMAYLLLRKFDRFRAIIASIVTIFWFYLPPGAPYIDTTAFFWGLIGLVILYQHRQPVPYKTFNVFLAGLCVGLSYLTKQNIGAFAVVLLALVIVLEGEWPKLISYFFGLAVPLGIFLVYLILVDGLNDYYYYAITVPLETRRILNLLPQAAILIWNILRPDTAYPLHWLNFFYELVLYCLIAWLILFFVKYRSDQKSRLSLILMFLLLFQHFSRGTSNNNWPLYYPFIGIIVVGIGILLLSNVPKYTAVLLVIGLIISGVGYYVSAERLAHGIDVTKINYTLKYPRLSGLKLDANAGSALDELLVFLDHNVPAQHKVFVYPYQTIVYGISAKPSPQPLLWFYRGVSYSKYSSSRTDHEIVDALKTNKVNWIIIQQDNLSGMRRFPQLYTYFKNNFRYVDTIDNEYLIYNGTNADERITY